MQNNLHCIFFDYQKDKEIRKNIEKVVSSPKPIFHNYIVTEPQTQLILNNIKKTIPISQKS